MEITYKFDDSKDDVKKGVKKNKFTKDRKHPYDTPHFDLSTGLPEDGYKQGVHRIEPDNPSFEGNYWFVSNNFNDEETNKRPLHPEPDYLNPEDVHTGDDYVEIHGVTHPEDKVNFEFNDNADSKNYDSVGNLDINKKNGHHLVGADNIKEEYKHIYKEKSNMKPTMQEQINRINQMIMFKEGMSYNDVKLLTEQEKEASVATADSTATSTKTFTSTKDASVTDDGSVEKVKSDSIDTVTTTDSREPIPTEKETTTEKEFTSDDTKKEEPVSEPAKDAEKETEAPAEEVTITAADIEKAQTEVNNLSAQYSEVKEYLLTLDSESEEYGQQKQKLLAINEKLIDQQAYLDKITKEYESQGGVIKEPEEPVKEPEEPIGPGTIFNEFSDLSQVSELQSDGVEYLNTGLDKGITFAFNGYEYFAGVNDTHAFEGLNDIVGFYVARTNTGLDSPDRLASPGDMIDTSKAARLVQDPVTALRADAEKYLSQEPMVATSVDDSFIKQPGVDIKEPGGDFVGDEIEANFIVSQSDEDTAILKDAFNVLDKKINIKEIPQSGKGGLSPKQQDELSSLQDSIESMSNEMEELGLTYRSAEEKGDKEMMDLTQQKIAQLENSISETRDEYATLEKEYSSGGVSKETGKSMITLNRGSKEDTKSIKDVAYEFIKSGWPSINELQKAILSVMPSVRLSSDVKSTSTKGSALQRGSYSAPVGFSSKALGNLNYGTAKSSYNPFGGAETGKYGFKGDIGKGMRGQLKDMSKSELLKLVSQLTDEESEEREELNENRYRRNRVIKENRNPRKKVIKLTEADLYKIVDRVITEKKKSKDWIEGAYEDAEPGKLTKYCGGSVTCKCVEKALDSKNMRAGAQLYLNTNKNKCKSLQNQ